MISRRQLTKLFATGGAVILAGCNGATPSNGTAPGGNASSPTATPVDAVERYYTADGEGDVEAINNVLHPESYNYPVENTEESNITIENTEEATIRTATRWQSGLSGVEASGDELDALVSEQETAIEELVSTINAEDYSFVAVTASSDGEAQTNYWLVVQNDSEWNVYVSSEYPFSFAPTANS